MNVNENLYIELNKEYSTHDYVIEIKGGDIDKDTGKNIAKFIITKKENN